MATRFRNFPGIIPMTIPPGNICTGRNQLPHDGLMSVGSGKEQGRVAVGVAGVDRRSGADQQFHRRRIAAAGRPDERA
jgi:hypothetical protein